MAKRFPFIALMLIVSSFAFGQTTKPQIEKAKIDPKTTESAAKADAQVVNKKVVADGVNLKTAFSKKRKMKVEARKKTKRRSS